jgi:cytidylate kinase
MAAPARLPNILITGTPGTGKTTTAEAVAAALGLTHVDVGKAIREQELHSGWDDKFECHIVDEDKVRRAPMRQRQMRASGVAHSSVAVHSCAWAAPGQAGLLRRGVCGAAAVRRRGPVSVGRNRR